MTEKSISPQAARDAYYERRRAFNATHKPAKCAYCGEDIIPGTYVLVAYHGIDRVVFCNHDCYANAHGACILCFGDDGYESLFDEKESGNET